MRFGCCGSLIAPATDPIGIEVAESLVRFGFDYIELSLSPVAALSEPDFARLRQRLDRAGIRSEAFNNFFPPQVRLTGAEARLPAALEYAKLAIERAAALGARVIVFGSSGAKNVPPGFPMDAAWNQLVVLLQHLGPLAAAHQVTIAIEPLNRQESNIINRAEEGLRLAQEVNHPNVQLLIDFYHLVLEREDPDIILTAGPALRHVHLAQVAGRVFPQSEAAEDWAGLFGRLRRAGYTGRCSIEAYTTDFATDAPHALRLLKNLA
jgi:D-psicose/D-tagatose/L-ribulose 3-epimerase